MDSGQICSTLLKHLQALLSKIEKCLAEGSFPGKCYQNAVEWLMAAWFSLDELCWECFSSHHTDLQPLHNTRVHLSLRKGKCLWVRKESSGAVSWGRQEYGRVLLRLWWLSKCPGSCRRGIGMRKCCRTGVQKEGVKGRKAAEQRENEMRGIGAGAGSGHSSDV